MQEICFLTCFDKCHWWKNSFSKGRLVIYRIVFFLCIFQKTGLFKYKLLSDLCFSMFSTKKWKTGMGKWQYSSSIGNFFAPKYYPVWSARKCWDTSIEWCSRNKVLSSKSYVYFVLHAGHHLGRHINTPAYGFEHMDCQNPAHRGLLFTGGFQLRSLERSG